MDTHHQFERSLLRAWLVLLPDHANRSSSTSASSSSSSDDDRAFDVSQHAASAAAAAGDTAAGAKAPPYTLDELRRLSQAIMENYTGDDLHIDDAEFDALQRPVVRGLIITLYVIVIVVGVIGNALVIANIVSVSNKNMQKTMKIFVVSLALSDIGLCAFSLPVQLYYQTTNRWIFGQIMCQFVFAAFAVPMYVSTMTILFIAIFRYRSLNVRLQVRSQRHLSLPLAECASTGTFSTSSVTSAR